MKFKPISFIFILFFLCFIFSYFRAQSYADKDFDISTAVTYNVQENGDTKVTQNVTIKNKTQFVYSPSYTVSVGFSDVRDVHASSKDGVLPNAVKKDSQGKSIGVSFPKRIVGIGTKNQFTITYTTSNIAKNKGNTWEVSIPGISDPANFTDYTSDVTVPESFGTPSILKPYKKFKNSTTYDYSKDEIGKAGIFIVFGDHQFYTLKLSYHLVDSQIVPVKTEIALPPQTNYQDARILSIKPEPADVYQDKDGNWLATYNLKPGEKKDIVANVVVKVFSNSTQTSQQPSKEDLKPDKYWESDNQEIKSLAQKLKTPEAIYKYVLKTLSYNYDKISGSNVRLGAEGALNKPNFAVCLEFTDLFVALARAANIPAREVEGYAYTDNSRLRPLSLVADVLHSWPEYYDGKSKTWIMVDPTWGNTTHGLDYFNDLDFDHIVFAIKGQSSTYPVPAGEYKLSGNSKDVNITLNGEDRFNDTINSSIIPNFPNQAFSGFPIIGTISIQNKGNVPLRNKTLNVNSNFTPKKQSYYVGTILPYGTKTITVSFDKTPFLTTRSIQVKIGFDGYYLQRTINVGMLPDYYLLVLGGIIICGSTIVASVTFKTWSIYFQGRKR